MVDSQSHPDPITRQIMDNPTKVLVVSTRAVRWLIEMEEGPFQIDWIGDAGQAMEILRRQEHELIVMNDPLPRDEILDFIREIKRRLPLVPIAMLSIETDVAYQTDLVEAGVDDFLSADAPEEALRRRLQLMLRQRRQNLVLARRNQNLHAVTLLSRRLHSADHPMNLIMETIDHVSATFDLYGLVIALDEGDKVHIYAGSRGVNNQRRLYESAVPIHNYDPFRQTMTTGTVQIFRDLNQHPFYTPIPVLPEARSAIIVPLKYGEQTFGAVGVLATDQQLLERDDLVIFELLASHFVSAYHNVRHYYTQDVNVQTTRHLLRAWQQLTNQYDRGEIASTLRTLATETSNVRQGLVWLDNTDDPNSEITISADNADAQRVFADLHKRGHIQKLIDLLDRRMQPITFTLGRDRQDAMGPLYRAMDGQQLLMVPIIDSARLLGLMFVSSSNTQQLQVEDINLLESLVHAAGQTLERNDVVSAMQEQTRRLEAILRSIREGIFFVAESGEVVFGNPQFTELTGINPSEVMYKPSSTLIDRLVQRAGGDDDLRQRLNDAIQAAQSANYRDGDYPIVDISVVSGGDPLFIEFTVINSDKGPASWLGFLRTEQQMKAPSQGSERRELLSQLLDNINVPYAQLFSSIMTLSDQHANFGRRERSQFLKTIEDQASHLGQLINNFSQIYDLEISGLILEREDVDLYDLVEHLLDNRTFAKHRRRVKVEVQPPRVMVHVDERYLERAFANIIERAVNDSPRDTPIHILFRTQGQELLVSVQDQGVGLSDDELARIFDPSVPFAGEDAISNLGLYLSRELISKHGGRVFAESRRGRGTIITVALPVASKDVDLVMESDRGSVRSSGNAESPGTVMVIESDSNIIASSYRELEGAGYELIPVETVQDALKDIAFVKVDLIIIEMDGVDMARRTASRSLRDKTQTPIMVISARDSEEERIQVLESGADDYITAPISSKELTVRIKTISKRQQIAERTLEPMQVGDMYIDFARREVYLGNKLLELTRIEYDLLQTLALNKEQVLTHRQLLEKVWGPEYHDETQYLWVNVSRLRRKLEPTPESQRYIHTQPGTGYIFRAP